MELLDKLKELWLQALRVDNSDGDNGGTYSFHKVKLNTVRMQEIIKLLHDSFSSHDSNNKVHEHHLILVENCFDYKEKKRCTLSLFLTEKFTDWLNAKNKKESEKESPAIVTIGEELVFKAFDVSTAHHLNLFSNFSNVYKFLNHKNLLKEKTLSCLKRLTYSDQALLLGELQLQEIYSVRELIIPLLIQNQYESIDAYVKNDIQVLANVLDVFNKLCDFNFHLKNFSKEYNHVPKKVLDRFKPKFLANYAQKALRKVNKLNLIDNYKNIKMQILLSQIRFLLSNRYDSYCKNEMSDEAWFELIVDIVQNEEALCVQLVNELIQYRKDFQTANYFLNLFNSERIIDMLPSKTQAIYTELEYSYVKKEVKTAIAKTERKDCFHQPPVQNIIFVDDEKKFEEFLLEFETCKNDYANVIGIDCEWRPTFGIDQEDSTTSNELCASTLQISNRKNSYIIDMTYFIKTINDAQLQRFANSILYSSDIVKIGYSFSQDLMRLQGSLPALKDSFNIFASQIIDADEFVNNFQLHHKDLFENLSAAEDKSKKSKGLSELVRKLFGKPLDKSECLSNWDRRPLREAQLKYAALDAYVLVQIYDLIDEKCKKENLDINDFLVF